MNTAMTETVCRCVVSDCTSNLYVSINRVSEFFTLFMLL